MAEMVVFNVVIIFLGLMSDLWKMPEKIHGDKYNYNKIDPTHIQNVESRLAVVSNKCLHEWVRSLKGSELGRATR